MIASPRNLMLADYLRKAAARPFAWGEHDCCLFAAGWVLAFAGVDPAAFFRGRYASEWEARRLVVKAGGLASLMAPQMTGFAETLYPLPGDVGAIRLGAAEQLVAIKVYGARWACLGLSGLVMTPGVLLRGWSICRPR